ncbi:Hypp6175 [Branchiostoma lanceolatum]|uniref:Hypp6175 protein n=1 Tax=Branchiostoma lanceolatum TaxID=7740 RepID=A0A8J9WHZ4_BRALA|nr:Hypp6175 [Branchiostoma lanceolatum]
MTRRCHIAVPGDPPNVRRMCLTPDRDLDSVYVFAGVPSPVKLRIKSSSTINHQYMWRDMATYWFNSRYVAMAGELAQHEANCVDLTEEGRPLPLPDYRHKPNAGAGGLKEEADGVKEAGGVKEEADGVAVRLPEIGPYLAFQTSGVGSAYSLETQT